MTKASELWKAARCVQTTPLNHAISLVDKAPILRSPSIFHNVFEGSPQPLIGVKWHLLVAGDGCLPTTGGTNRGIDYTIPDPVDQSPMETTVSVLQRVMGIYFMVYHSPQQGNEDNRFACPKRLLRSEPIHRIVGAFPTR